MRLVFKIFRPKNNVVPDNQDHFYSINAITHLTREHLILERRLELLLLCINLCERWRRSTSLLRRTQAFLRRMSGENYHKRLPMVCKKKRSRKWSRPLQSLLIPGRLCPPSSRKCRSPLLIRRGIMEQKEEVLHRTGQTRNHIFEEEEW